MNATEFPIVEIFKSFQGEGYHAGTLVSFIRFSGCNLQCEFCDTDHQTFEMKSVQSIVAAIESHETRTVIFTGGEPTLQPFGELVKALREKHYTLMLETNGTGSKESCAMFDWVAASPKRDSDWSFNGVANELKIVVDERLTVNEVSRFVDFPGKKYLQPESNSPLMVHKAMTIATLLPQFKIGMQLQKIWDIR